MGFAGLSADAVQRVRALIHPHTSLRKAYEAVVGTKSPATSVHRMIATVRLGRRLRANQEVHHRNLNHYDDDPLNIVVVGAKKHRAIHKAERRRRRADKDAYESPLWRERNEGHLMALGMVPWSDDVWGPPEKRTAWHGIPRPGAQPLADARTIIEFCRGGAS